MPLAEDPLIAGPPPEPDAVVVPAVVRALAAGRGTRPVWLNELGGLTFELGGEEFVKWGPPHREFSPSTEAGRLRWARRWIAVPEVLGVGTDDDGNPWLHTRALSGVSAVLDGWAERPQVVVPELGRALRRLHDVLPVAQCPWEWSIDARLLRAALSPSDFAGRPDLDAVVCHGDACNPNFLLDEAGRCIGYVDLGSLGVADRWADLAPALQSLDWNFGPNWKQAFLDAYGVARDAAKQDFYTRLWNAS